MNADQTTTNPDLSTFNVDNGQHGSEKADRGEGRARITTGSTWDPIQSRVITVLITYNRSRLLLVLWATVPRALTTSASRSRLVLFWRFQVER